MKTRFFTRLITLGFLAFGLGQFATAQTLDDGIGTGWDGLNPGSPLVLKTDFSTFDFFHSDDNPSDGNSDNVLDGTTGDIVMGYKELVTKMPYIGSSISAKFSFYQCAFAPTWKTAYAYKDTLENTPGVTDGFVEISREYSTDDIIPTVRGYMTIDLRSVDFVEAIQYSHSSTGGNKRGFLLEYSLDDAATWDTLRYQPGSAWQSSFTTDLFTFDKVPNGYRCNPSAFGMLWEDAIYTSNLMLRFSEAGGQTPRIHDFKVYGDGLTDIPDGITEVKADAITIKNANGVLMLSAIANVSIFNAAGALVLSAKNTNQIAVSELSSGLYIVKAISETLSGTSKIMIK